MIGWLIAMVLVGLGAAASAGARPARAALPRPRRAELPEPEPALDDVYERRSNDRFGIAIAHPGSVTWNDDDAGYTVGAADDSPGYAAQWEHEPVWFSDKSRLIVFRSQGALVHPVVRTIVSDEDLIPWLDAMEMGPFRGKEVKSTMRPTTTAGWGVIVDPAPPRTALIYNCLRSPSGDVIKDAACARYPWQRSKLWVRTFDVGDGWFVSAWNFGPLFAAPTSASDVHDIGLALVAEFVEGRRIVYA